MSITIPEPSAILSQATYLPRVGTFDGRAIEAALAGPTIFDRGVRLEGAVVEATYAAAEPAPPLLARLRQEGVPYVVDTQALRFAAPAFLEFEHLRSLEYAPRTVVQPATFTKADASCLARAALLFQQRVGVSYLMAPALPVLDADVEGWIRTNRDLRACPKTRPGEVRPGSYARLVGRIEQGVWDGDGAGEGAGGDVAGGDGLPG